MNKYKNRTNYNFLTVETILIYTNMFPCCNYYETSDGLLVSTLTLPISEVEIVL